MARRRTLQQRQSSPCRTYVEEARESQRCFKGKVRSNHCIYPDARKSGARR